MIRLHRYSIPFRSPFIGHGFSISHREGILLELPMRSGQSAWGEAAPLPGFSTESLQDVILETNNIRFLSVDEILHPDEESWYKQINLPTYSPAFQFALDTLRTDALSLSNAQSFVETLFGRVKGWGYATDEKPHPSCNMVEVNGVLGLDAPEAMRRKAETLLESGFRTLKIKIENPEPYLDVLHHIAAHPASPVLRFDANGGWPVDRAVAWAKQLEPLHPEYIEQPFPPGCDAYTRQLRKAISFPIAADESAGDAASIRQLLADQLVDVLILKPSRIGSFQNLAEISHLARKQQIKTVVTTLLETGIGRRACASLAAIFGTPETAHGLSTGAMLTADPLPDAGASSRYLPLNTTQRPFFAENIHVEHIR